ncbi:S24 family peptidase, partial [Xanthomonas citri pv. citri]
MAIRERPRDIAIAEVAISAIVSASGPEVAVVDTGRCLPFPVTWFEHHPVAAADVRVITVEGDSMERTLFHGDRIAINLRDTRITDGRVHVMVTGGPAPAVKV